MPLAPRWAPQGERWRARTPFRAERGQQCSGAPCGLSVKDTLTASLGARSVPSTGRTHLAPVAADLRTKHDCRGEPTCCTEGPRVFKIPGGRSALPRQTEQPQTGSCETHILVPTKGAWCGTQNRRELEIPSHPQGLFQEGNAVNADWSPSSLLGHGRAGHGAAGGCPPRGAGQGPLGGELAPPADNWDSCWSEQV